MANPPRVRRPAPPPESVSFDYRTEILQRKASARERRKFLIDPQLPTIAKEVEIHCPKVYLTFTLQFLALCGYATVLDVVARELLRDRAAFNAYLQEFDSYIARASDKINERLAVYEAMAKQQMTANRRPQRSSVEIAGRRGLQILSLYEATDRLLRHAQYLEVMDEIENARLINLEMASIKTLRNAFRSMRGVILRVKAKIQDERLEYRRQQAELSEGSAAEGRPAPGGDEIDIVTAERDQTAADLPVMVSASDEDRDASLHLEAIERVLAMGGDEDELPDADQPRTVVRTRRVAAE